MQCQIVDMDLRQIAASGQCFRMEEREDGWFSIIAGDRYLEIRRVEDGAECKDGAVGKNGAGLFQLSCPEPEFQAFWSHYFDLETDYGAIKGRIAKRDRYLNQAAERGWGIRILNQDLWEMIITFIISQQNNIPRIRRCVRLLCERYGKKLVNFRGESYYGFPEPEALAGADLEDLKACNLGYRARYLLETAGMVSDGRFVPEQLYGMGHEEARAELLKLCGVGVKVAECVCLFALHHVDAFPIDTHIAQVLEQHYPKGFPYKRYHGFAGILQQYMFFYEVENKNVPQISRERGKTE